MDRHNLCAVSQCEWATGPLHTYVSGNSMTTVDCIIASLDATSIISSCKTLPMTDLNTSDHLPLAAELTIEYPVQTQPDTCHPWLDWEQASKSGEINENRRLVKQQLSGLNSHACFDGMEDIEAAISHLSDRLKNAAAKSLPGMCYKKPHKWKDASYIFSTLHPKQSGPTNLEREWMPKRRTTL